MFVFLGAAASPTENTQQICETCQRPSTKGKPAPEGDAYLEFVLVYDALPCSGIIYVACIYCSCEEMLVSRKVPAICAESVSADLR